MCGHVLAIEAVDMALKNMVDVAVEGTKCEVAMLSSTRHCVRVEMSGGVIVQIGRCIL